MTRLLSIFCTLLIISASTSYAGLYSSGYNREGGTVVAAVEIKDKGLYNLIVNIQFLHRPQKNKIYISDDYEKLIDRLTVESRGIALQRILEHNALSLNELSELKQKFLSDKDVEVAFSVSDMYLLEPKDN